MTKLEKLEKVSKEMKRMKNVMGYQYGKTDCWSFFTLYDAALGPDDSIRTMVTGYNSPKTFHNRVKALGFSNIFELIKSRGYTEISLEQVEAGDICVFKSPIEDYTIAIFDGKSWVNSSNEPSYEKLPTRFIKPKLVFLGRKGILSNA